MLVPLRQRLPIHNADIGKPQFLETANKWPSRSSVLPSSPVISSTTPTPPSSLSLPDPWGVGNAGMKDLVSSQGSDHTTTIPSVFNLDDFYSQEEKNNRKRALRGVRLLPMP
jgi:hypothetical protein